MATVKAVGFIYLSLFPAPGICHANYCKIHTDKLVCRYIWEYRNLREYRNTGQYLLTQYSYRYIDKTISGQRKSGRGAKIFAECQDQRELHTLPVYDGKRMDCLGRIYKALPGT